MDYTLEQACAVLQRTPATLSALLDGLDVVWTSQNEGGDSFSPFDVVGHLIDAETFNWLPRVALILEQENGTFPPFDRFAHKQRNLGRTMQSLLQEFAVARALSLERLRAFDIAPNLERTANHPTFGQVRLRQLLSTWVVHELGHLAQIARVMAKQYRFEVGAWAEFLPILSDRETNPTVFIRQATPADLEPMLVWRGHSTAARAAIEYEFKKLPSQNTIIFLAHAGTKLVGTVQMVRFHPDPDLTREAVYLQAVEVRPELRRQGLAKRLCLALEAQAKHEHKKRVTVAVEPHNSASLGLFASLGYLEFKRSSFVWDGQELPVLCLEKWL
jgi:ribosomal protein S18 acetylase RimI-like enzyme